MRFLFYGRCSLLLSKTFVSKVVNAGENRYSIIPQVSCLAPVKVLNP